LEVVLLPPVLVLPVLVPPVQQVQQVLRVLPVQVRVLRLQVQQFFLLQLLQVLFHSSDLEQLESLIEGEPVEEDKLL
jgi:hypothetical protein